MHISKEGTIQQATSRTMLTYAYSRIIGWHSLTSIITVLWIHFNTSGHRLLVVSSHQNNHGMQAHNKKRHTSTNERRREREEKHDGERRREAERWGPIQCIACEVSASMWCSYTHRECLHTPHRCNWRTNNTAPLTHRMPMRWTMDDHHSMNYNRTPDYMIDTLMCSLEVAKYMFSLSYAMHSHGGYCTSMQNNRSINAASHLRSGIMVIMNRSLASVTLA